MLAVTLLSLLTQTQAVSLPAGPGPLDNPLKGFASYCDPGIPLNCPVSMAYEYASLKELEPQEGQFAWDQWEAKWNEQPAKGKDVVLRVVLDYPHEPVDVPQWLIDKGVRMNRYDEFGGGLSPDYENPDLRKAMLDFIRAFGRRYDHDDRVAYVQLGMLGHWGEWHTYPRTELFASPRVQSEIVQAMHKAFPDKPLLARNASYASCQLPWLGFHDDMIPQDTLGPEDWKFVSQIRNGGVSGNWKTEPLGGEMVPEAAAQYLGKDWSLLQDAVRTAHFTWIGPYCPAMLRNPSDEQLDRIHKLVRMLGYQFRLKTARLSPESLEVDGVNEGVAPLYANWKAVFVLIDARGRIAQRLDTAADPRTWLPGEFTARASAPMTAPAGTYRVGFGIVDPQRNQARIRFANDLDAVDGYTILGTVRL